MRRTVLIIEDERRIREIVADYFSEASWHVYEAQNGVQALEQFGKHRVDLVILDIMIPQLDGWSVCQRIRQMSAVPIIMLTAKSNEEDKLLGFELGADDYVTKPFSPKVLVARAKTLMKRVERTVGHEDHIVSFGKVKLDNLAHTVHVDGQSIDLSSKEYDVLLFLIKNENIVLSRETILNHVWGIDYYGDPRVVDTYIKKLRGKLGADARHIATVFRTGYKFGEVQ